MKVNLRIKIDSIEPLNIKVKGIKKDNTYTYFENDIKVIIYYSENYVSIKRECNDYKIDLNLKKNKKSISTYSVFGGSKIFSLNTECTKINITDKKIKVEYKIDEDKFKYVLEVI